MNPAIFVLRRIAMDAMLFDLVLGYGHDQEYFERIVDTYSYDQIERLLIKEYGSRELFEQDLIDSINQISKELNYV